MARDDVTGLAAKAIIMALTFGFLLWYVTMKLTALHLGAP